MANTKTSREQRVINGRIGGIKSQTLEQQAKRIVQHWPELTTEQKSAIRQMLRPVIIGNSR